ncbi:hypothetical protein NDU88_002587 [Pleurodeles waltl]|uniref:Uncharacterized protein n=1 Tax=Pleurodeles waltl TaxID=8319 RepID=A0AAV7Q7E5_PLEWA|nr:hypothetical protein NDU88_002587 [Pleurodeles waltl]
MILRGPIVEIRTRAAGLVHAPGEMQAEVTRHYRALYAAEVPPLGNPCSEFLAGVELPSLKEEQMEALEAPHDLEEIKSSIRELASGRSCKPCSYQWGIPDKSVLWDQFVDDSEWRAKSPDYN